MVGFPLTRTSLQLGATGSSTASAISVALSYPAFSTMFFVPKNPTGALDLAITITQGGAQAITATASMATGTPGIPGTVIIMTASHVNAGVNQSMFMVGVITLLEIPLGNGKAGQFTSTFSLLQAPHQITIDFYGWTPHTHVFASLSSLGESLPSVSAMGSFALDAMGVGTVTLVSPTRIIVTGALAAQRIASITTLKLTFVPEPGTLLLLGAAALALLVIRRQS